MALELVVPLVAQVQDFQAVTDPYHPLELQEFLQVALEAALQLDLPTSAPSADMESPDLAPLMEMDTSVSVLPPELDSSASPRYADLQAAVSALALEAPASARQAYLDRLTLARELASEAALLHRVHMDSPRRAPEAFPAPSLPLPGAASKALAPMVLGATMVVTTVDFLITATVTMVLVWAAASDGADKECTQELSMVRTAAMASVATPLALDSEVFTALASKVPLATLDLVLSYL